MSVPHSLFARFTATDGSARWWRWLEATLLALLALQAARLLWLLLPASPIGEAVQPVSGASIGLPTIDMFYRNEMPTDAPAAASGYSLRGVRISADGGSAILVDTDGHQQAYKVGEHVAPGLVLERVGRGHVSLRGAGGLQRLELPALGEGTNPAALPTSLATSSTASDASAIDPASLLAQAGLSANAGGGYTINPRGDSGPLQAAGLQAGDVIEAIDGQDLTAERIGALQDEIAPGKAVSLTIRRNGQTRTITLPAKP